MTDLSTHPTQIASAWLADFASALEQRRHRRRGRPVRARQLLARPGRLHLEHPHAGGRRGDPRDAEGAPGRYRSRPPSRSRAKPPRPTASSRPGSPSRPRVARGRGHLRLRDGKAWTLLTTMTELKGFEETKGERRVKGAEHGVQPGRKTWLERRQEEEPDARLHRAALRRDHRRRPGRHRARRAAAAAGRADHHRRAQRPARRLLAQALQVAVPARPGLVRPPALPAVPRRLAGVHAQGQDRRLARDVHQGDGAQLLGLAPPRRRRASTRRSRNGKSTVERDGKEVVLRPKQLVFALGVSGYPNVPKIPGAENFEGEQHHSSQHPGPEAYARQEVRGARLQQLGARHLRRPVGARRRRDHDPALARRTSRRRIR